MLFRSDRKSTRLNSSHTLISYAVFCLKKKKKSKRLSSNHTITYNLRLSIQNKHVCDYLVAVPCGVALSFCKGYGAHLYLHSFPTRRSSDLLNSSHSRISYPVFLSS